MTLRHAILGAGRHRLRDCRVLAASDPAGSGVSRHGRSPSAARDPERAQRAVQHPVRRRRSAGTVLRVPAPDAIAAVQRSVGAVALRGAFCRDRPDDRRLGLLSSRARQRTTGVGPAADDGRLHGTSDRDCGRALEPGAGAAAVRSAPGVRRRQRRRTGPGASSAAPAICGRTRLRSSDRWPSSCCCSCCTMRGTPDPATSSPASPPTLLRKGSRWRIRQSFRSDIS